MTFQSHTKGRQGMVMITNRVERNAAHVRCIASLMGVCSSGFIERLAAVAQFYVRAHGARL